MTESKSTRKTKTESSRITAEPPAFVCSGYAYRYSYGIAVWSAVQKRLSLSRAQRQIFGTKAPRRGEVSATTKALEARPQTRVPMLERMLLEARPMRLKPENQHQNRGRDEHNLPSPLV